MILEYLFLDDTSFEKLKAFKYNHKVESKGKVTREITAAISFNKSNETNHWIMRIELNGKNSRESAKHLSKINESIMQYKPIVLENESSAYFNQQLYPLVNFFERNLRRFLYLKTNLSKENITNQAIGDLEKMTFEQIYKLLFVDQNFCKAAQSYTKNNNYSRNELIAKLQQFKENTMWDAIVEPNVLLLIKEDFLILKDYRNDIMHAHNIDYETYKNALKLYTKANIQLLAQVESLLVDTKPSNSSDLLVNAIYYYFGQIGETLDGIKHFVSNFYHVYSELSNISMNPEIKQAINNFLQLSNLDQNEPEESEHKDEDDLDDPKKR